MLDSKKVGLLIASFRKKNQLSQEVLAELLSISPQAISKWENGHSLPETSLLPRLAQIFKCSIDELLMTAYVIDEEIEKNAQAILEQQAEHIAKHIMDRLDKEKSEEHIGFDDETIINLSSPQKDFV